MHACQILTAFLGAPAREESNMGARDVSSGECQACMHGAIGPRATAGKRVSHPVRWYGCAGMDAGWG